MDLFEDLVDKPNKLKFNVLSRIYGAQNHQLTFSELAQYVQITSKTSRRVIEELKYDKAEYRVWRGKGIVIGQFHSSFSLYELKKSYIKNSLKYKLLQSCFKEESLSVNDFCTENYISKSTFYQWKKQMNKAFSNFFTIQTEKNRMSLKGDELKIRLFFFRLARLVLCQDRVSGTNGQKKIGENFEKNNQFFWGQLSEKERNLAQLYLYLSAYRMENGKGIEKLKYSISSHCVLSPFDTGIKNSEGVSCPISSIELRSLQDILNVMTSLESSWLTSFFIQDKEVAPNLSSVWMKKIEELVRFESKEERSLFQRTYQRSWMHETFKKHYGDFEQSLIRIEQKTLLREWIQLSIRKVAGEEIIKQSIYQSLLIHARVNPLPLFFDFEGTGNESVNKKILTEELAEFFEVVYERDSETRLIVTNVPSRYNQYKSHIIVLNSLDKNEIMAVQEELKKYLLGTESKN